MHFLRARARARNRNREVYVRRQCDYARRFAEREWETGATLTARKD